MNTASQVAYKSRGRVSDSACPAGVGLAVWIVVLVALVSLNCPAAGAAEHPNVVVILADDQGWGDLSCHGNRNLATPHLDSLARGGASLRRFFVCPVCSPTRAEFLTGRYHVRSGVSGVSTGRERMSADEVTIADMFRAAGYATAAFGKWHNGTQHPYHPNARGFDEFYGFCSGHWGHYFDPFLEHNGQPTRGEGYLTNDLIDHAIEFLAAHRDQPSLVYLPLNIPHSPMQVPDKWFESQRNSELAQRGTDAEREKLDHTRAALAMCENIDANVGRLLDALDDLGIADGTIVVYFSDNGPNGHRWNAKLRGIKGSTDEGGVRSPCLVRWPGQIPAGKQIMHIAGAIDLLPTLADLTDVPLTNTKPLDGMSLTPLLTGDQGDWPDRKLFHHWGGRVSARTEQYRLDNRGRLYDMRADERQTKDIADEQPDVAERLRLAVADYRRDVIAPNQIGQRAFDVGYPGSPNTWLPARDGAATGGIERSSRHPNCSYFTNWTKMNERVTWKVNVHEPGNYQVTLYYTCPPENVGCRLQLASGLATLTRTIDEAHDPPAYGSEHDRSPRTESLVKDFRPLEFGQMDLATGEQMLELYAIEIPGDGAIDVRLLILEKTK